MAKNLKPVALDFLDNAPQRTVVQTRIAHPVGAVFAALAEDPAGWGNWFPGFAKGGSYTTAAPHGVGVTREMKMGGLALSETVLAWDSPSRWAFYVARGTMPGIKAFAEDYRLAADGDGTVLTWTLALELSAAGKPGGPIIGLAAKALIRRAGKRLDRYLSSSVG
jgi:hypothetical protein